MKKLLALAFALIMAFGCLQPPNPEANATNQSNVTAPPGNLTNLTDAANVTIQVPPGYEVKDYCEKDGDCVRQKKCCDCGAGEYVNRYNLDDPVCTGQMCACPTQQSISMCRKNKCMAVPLEANETDQPEEGFYFRSGQPSCGNEIKPVKSATGSRTTFSGAISAPNPCYMAKAKLTKSDDAYILNITTEPLKTFAACTQCTGSIPWFADINGSGIKVEIYYGSTLAYAELEPFCGWSTGSCDTDYNCRVAGCNSQVCTSDPNIYTTCEWKSCYAYWSYGLGCGCVNHQCKWR